MTNSDDDIDHWVDVLAGLRPPDPSTQDEREAAALRTALLRTSNSARLDAVDTPPTEDERKAQDHGWQRLVFRLRREGVLATRSRWSDRRWIPAAAAATVVMAVTANLVFQHAPGSDFPVEYDGAPQLRGQVLALSVKATHPIAAAQRLAAQVQSLGVVPKVYASGNEATVDMDVTVETLEQVQVALKKNAIPVTQIRPGLLRVEFIQGK